MQDSQVEKLLEMAILATTRHVLGGHNSSVAHIKAHLREKLGEKKKISRWKQTNLEL